MIIEYWRSYQYLKERWSTREPKFWESQQDDFTRSGKEGTGHKCLKSTKVTDIDGDSGMVYYERIVTGAIGVHSVHFSSPGAGKLRTSRGWMRRVKKFSSAHDKFRILFITTSSILPFFHILSRTHYICKNASFEGLLHAIYCNFLYLQLNVRYGSLHSRLYSWDHETLGYNTTINWYVNDIVIM
jgi:hypothetical protein